MGTNDKHLFVLYSSFPKHRVILTQGFWMATSLITYRHYEALTNIFPPSYVENSDVPFANTIWDEALDVCSKLNKKFEHQIFKSTEGQQLIIGGNVTFDLPTEAQWEYACRCGTETAWHFGDEPRELYKYGWYSWKNEYLTFPPVKNLQIVMQKSPNPYGIYDLYGLVHEWCKDDFGPIVPEKLQATRIDPLIIRQPVFVNGSVIKPEKVVRGGDIYSPAKNCHSSARENISPDNPSNELIGIRIILRPMEQGNLGPMKRFNYYLIRPKDNLIERVMEYNRANDTEVNKIFLDTELWSKRTTSRAVDDDRDRVKVLFICDLYAEYLANDFLQRTNPNLYKFFVEVLGLPPYSLDTFDKWWHVEYIGNGVNEFEAYERDVGRLSVDLFPKTNNPKIDRWLESIKTASTDE